MPSVSSPMQISQLSSRGLRYAPVKNTRVMCAKIATMNMIAAQWWICLISRPPRMSNEMFSVDWYACDIERPSSLVYEPWYTTTALDGSKNSARYVPVSSRITNDHSAISPSMKDQWSGKTSRIRTRTPLAPWNRSSSHPPTPETAGGIFTASSLIPSPRWRSKSAFADALVFPIRSQARSSALPEARADRLREVASGRDVALRGQHERQLRQRAGRRAEDHVGPVRRVERRLVARAEDVVGRLLVQGDRAADVRTDLGVGDDVVDRPVHRRHQRPAVIVRRDVQLARRELDQDDAGLREGVVVVLVALRDDRDQAARRGDVRGRQRPQAAERDRAQALAPDRVPQRGLRQRAEVAQQHERRERKRGGRGQQRAAHQGPPGDLGDGRALGEFPLERLAFLRIGRQVVPLLGDLDVRRQVPDPDQRAGAEREQRDGERRAERHVRPQHRDDRVGALRDRADTDLKADVGRDEPDTSEEGDHEEHRDDSLGVLRVPGVLRLVRDRRPVGLGPHVDRLRRGRGGSDDPARACRLLRRLPHDCCSDSPLTWSRRLAVSHMAMSTRKPRPPTHPRRPSVTVPVRPSEKPPGLASFRVAMTYAMMSCFSAGVIVPSPKTGMASGPVSIAS